MRWSEDEITDKLVKKMKSEKKVKDSRILEVVEEVFDYRTLMALYKLLNDGVIKRVYGAVAAGKEARIYWAQGSQDEDLALKIYLVTASEFRRGRLAYIEGDPRFRRLRGDVRKIVEAWCSKEYRNLIRAWEAGVRVPRPIARNGNILVMEFIGDPEARGRPAPLLKDVELDDPAPAFETLKQYIIVLYRKAKLVHADLSEYNVMVRGDELVLIDFGSAVDTRHPRALEFLERDIRNIFLYFARLGVETGDPRNFLQQCLQER
ncbi:MAG: serine protein kinase RIO [Thermofilaceae archaeon]